MHNLTGKIAAVLFFVTVFISVLTPITDADFYWHLTSGEWIWSHKELPSSDPFVFTPEVLHLPANNIKDVFFLKCYWLSELLLYAAYSLGALKGIILYKGLVYLLLMLFIYLFLKKEGVKSHVIFLLLLPVISHSVFLYAREWNGDRPGNLSFLFAIILFYLLENAKKRDGEGYVAAVPVIVLLWANLHSGVVVGVLMICVYLSEVIFRKLARKRPLEAGQKHIVFAGLTAIALSFLNPNTYNIYLAPFFSDVLLKDYVAEWQGPVELWKNGSSSLYLTYIILLLALVLPFIRKMSYIHISLLALFTAMAFSAVRHLPFFVFFSVPIIILYWSPYIDSLLDKIRLRAFLPYILILIITLIAYTNVNGTILKNRNILLRGFYPFEAADFIKNLRPEPFIYNYYSWGGFLDWQLFPEYRLFIDGRGRNKTVFETYRLIEKASTAKSSSSSLPSWQELLNLCRIDTIVIPAVSSSGEYFPLFGELLDDPEWSIAYMDRVAYVFLRNTRRNQAIISRFSINRPTAIDWSIFQAESIRQARPSQYLPYFSLGILNLLAKNNTAALANFEKAAALNKSLLNSRFSELLQRLRHGDTSLRPRDILAVM